MADIPQENIYPASMIYDDAQSELEVLLTNLCATLDSERDPLPSIPVTANDEDQENYLRLHHDRLITLASTIRIVCEALAMIRAAVSEDVSLTQFLTKEVQDLIQEKLGLDGSEKISDTEDA